jgi:hypothetical protein
MQSSRVARPPDKIPMPQRIYTFSRKTITELERGMHQLLASCGARSALIVDQSGYVLCSSGAFSSLHAKDLGVMAAATSAALNKMVNIADSREMSIRFHSPKVEKIFFAMLNERTFITVLYDTSSAGRHVREATREFVREARRLLATRRPGTRKLRPVPLIAKDLERLFRSET